MKLHLYKVLLWDREQQPIFLSAFENATVMTERDLRKEFVRAWESGKIPTELKNDFINDPDYKKENWDDIDNLSAGTMVDIMNEIYNYNCSYYYYILETDIEVPVEEKQDIKVDIDIKVILNGTPTYLVGECILNYASVVVGDFYVGGNVYTVNALFDMDTEVKELVITDSNDTIINTIKGV